MPDERIIVDVKGLRGKEPFIRVRDALGSCREANLIDVITDSEDTERKLQSFMVMSGCVIERKKSQDGWMLRVNARNCRCG